MAAKKDESRSFEALYQQLEEKARQLEAGNVPLEASLKLYEDGAALVDQLREVLDAAELRIRTVQGRTEPVVSAFRETGEPFGEDDRDWEDES
ncbi:MAG: exodeoxyribonuclease VII small subunit [Dehalococcoidia bacterium]